MWIRFWCYGTFLTASGPPGIPVPSRFYPLAGLGRPGVGSHCLASDTHCKELPRIFPGSVLTVCVASVMSWVFSPCPSSFCGLLTIRLPNESALTPLTFLVDFIFSAQLMLALVFIYSFLLLSFGFNSFFILKNSKG